jgi:hypothetical protein
MSTFITIIKRIVCIICEFRRHDYLTDTHRTYTKKMNKSWLSRIRGTRPLLIARYFCIGQST